VKRIAVALIGSGNIGTDLMMKVLRSETLDCKWMAGVDAASQGLAMARERGIRTTAAGAAGLVEHMRNDGVRIAFDATSAYAHADNARRLNAEGVVMIDLTPAALGPYCVPCVNLEEQVAKRAMNLNMVSCGGQATIPVVAAISGVQPVEYAEIIATVASRSAGPGTRANIDEFTRTTAKGIEVVGGARRGKAIIILNPAEPPLIMRDTVHCLTEGEPDRDKIDAAVQAMIASVRRYVPGYTLKNGPVYDGRRISVFLEVAGLGDYLPVYAGNLDIMTAAALRTGEMIAQQMQEGRFGA
jgi:acetaldehyde/propanal dehydrogenase